MEAPITEIKILLVEIRDALALQKTVLNSRECAAYMGIQPERLRALVREGKVPAYRLGSRYKFRRAEIDEYMTSQKIFTTADAERIAAEYCTRNPLKRRP